MRRRPIEVEEQEIIMVTLDADATEIASIKVDFSEKVVEEISNEEGGNEEGGPGGEIIASTAVDDGDDYTETPYLALETPVEFHALEGIVKVTAVTGEDTIAVDNGTVDSDLPTVGDSVAAITNVGLFMIIDEYHDDEYRDEYGGEHGGGEEGGPGGRIPDEGGDNNLQPNYDEY